MGAHLTRFLTGTAGRVVVAAAALACVGAAAVSQGAVRSGVQRVRFGGDLHETRLVIELDRSAHARLAANADGRMTLALPGVGVVGDREGEGQGLVKAWSVDCEGGEARLKLALNGPVTIRRRFLLSPSEGSPSYRYVIDLAAAGPAKAPTSGHGPALMRTSAALTRTRKVIVIDAGHGGKDPGAAGADGREKAVTLAAARTLAEKLEKTGRYRVVLTRSDDEFVPLETRVQIARRADADLFISLHADAGTDASLKGATVYTLSDEGSDRAAKKAIDQRGYFLDVSMPGQNRAVNQILLDLTQRATKNRSSVFAESVVERVSEVEEMSRRSHRNAGFVVLLAPDVPAVLLEMGFITNADDERQLTDASHRNQLMSAVARSIDDYFGVQRTAMR